MSNQELKELQTPNEFQSCNDWIKSLPVDLVETYNIQECEGGTDFWIRRNGYVTSLPIDKIWRVEDHKLYLAIWSDRYVTTIYKEVNYVRFHIFK